MAASKHPGKASREEYLCKLAKLDRRGLSQSHMARQLGVSQPQISNDLKILRKRYIAQQLIDRESLVAQKRRQYEEIRKEAFSAWERSKNDVKKVTVTTEQSLCKTCEGAGEVVHNGQEIICPCCSGEGFTCEKKVSETTHGRLPDNGYLQAICDTYEAERSLLGIDAPKPSAGGVNVNISNTNTQAVALNWDSLCQPRELRDPVTERIKHLEASTDGNAQK